MHGSAELEQFVQLLLQVTRVVGDGPLDDRVQQRLNNELAPSSDIFRHIFSACQGAIDVGWMCARSAGGIRFGRVIKPSQQLGRFSVDVVEMSDIVGPAHAHPNGEIDMIMPLNSKAQFDGQGAGWLVYPPASRHAPTVTGGKALILYLLPHGAIDFSGAT